MKNLEDQVKKLNEKLSGAQAEMPNKDNIVKQHAKVAEEAVSGLILIYLRYVEGKETCAVTLGLFKYPIHPPNPTRPIRISS